MNTNKKFTIILSAFDNRACNAANYRAHIALLAYITARTDDVHQAMGMYKGEVELSYVVNTNSSNIVSQLREHAWYRCNQQCVLVSNNRKNEIGLYHSDWEQNDTIGSRFVPHTTAPRGVDAYTYVDDVYYTVA